MVILASGVEELAAEAGGGLLLWNTLSLELVFLEGKTEADWAAERFSEEERHELGERFFFVPNDFDEKAEHLKVRAMYDFYHAVRQGVNCEIYTTYACNARCWYCSEAGRYPVSVSMTEETALRTADFLADRFKGKLIKLGWFGGEPLVGKKAIETITRRLTERGENFVSTMITNGYLFDRQTAEKAESEWKLNWAQITLDGTSEVYKRAKAYVSKPVNPLEKVLQAIENLLEYGVSVVIRLNLSEENGDDLTELVRQLDKRFSGELRPRIRLAPLFQLYPLSFGESRKDRERFSALFDLIRQLGFSDSAVKLGKDVWGSNCVMDRGDGFTVSPEGKISGCINPARAGFQLGDVFSGISPEASIAELKKKRLTRDCPDCTIQLICLCDHCKSGKSCTETRRWFLAEPYRRAMIQEYNKWKENETE